MDFSTFAQSKGALPIDEALPRLTEALAAFSRAVLVAPPGAGKTTRVPLALLDAGWRGDGKIIVLEPRRLAARAAAERMAGLLDQNLGETDWPPRAPAIVDRAENPRRSGDGGRFRPHDPRRSLAGGRAAVLFDEFHERSLDADLGLALALDAQAALRPDLRILVMSATLDGARVAALMDGAAVIEVAGPRLSG